MDGGGQGELRRGGPGACVRGGCCRETGGHPRATAGGAAALRSPRCCAVTASPAVWHCCGHGHLRAEPRPEQVDHQGGHAHQVGAGRKCRALVGCKRSGGLHRMRAHSSGTPSAAPAPTAAACYAPPPLARSLPPWDERCDKPGATKEITNPGDWYQASAVAGAVLLPGCSSEAPEQHSSSSVAVGAQRQPPLQPTPKLTHTPLLPPLSFAARVH